MRAVEVFAGAGGMCLGLQAAGIRVLQAYDSQDLPIIVRHDNGLPGKLQDVTYIPVIAAEIERLGGVDIIAGSPPVLEINAFALLISATLPEWFLYESVRDAHKSDDYQRARHILVLAGYGLTELQPDAARYRSTHGCQRFVVVGRRGERDGFLTAALEGIATETRRPIRDVLDPRDPDDAALIASGYYFTRPFGQGRGVRSIDGPTPGMSRTFRERPYSAYLENPHPDDPIPCTEAHLVTLRQMSTFAGFPRDWIWNREAANVAQVEQMIADATPLLLAFHIGKVIVDRHNGSIPAIDAGFRDWLKETKKFEDGAVGNTCARVNRARKMLAGRTFENIALEIAALENTTEFKALDKRQQSDLRSALRLYAELPRAPSPYVRAEEKRPADKRMFDTRPRWRPKWTDKDLLLTPPRPPGRPPKIPNLNAMTRPGADPTRPDPDFDEFDD